MFFNDIAEITRLVERSGFVIIATNPKTAKNELEKKLPKSTIYLSPEPKSQKITIDQIRSFTSTMNSKDTSEHFLVVTNAEKMTTASENAFLKNLEEPKGHHHFVLLTNSPSSLLPTVLSRAQIYYQKETDAISRPIDADDKIKALAKELITASPSDLIALADKLSKVKDNPREHTLKVVGTAIEILYKSYFKTEEEKYLKKLPRLISLYDNIKRNGHLKLHIVADML